MNLRNVFKENVDVFQPKSTRKTATGEYIGIVTVREKTDHRGQLAPQSQGVKTPLQLLS